MQLLHVYGPTESTTLASWYLVRDVPEGATTIPIGRPLANTQLYVLDHHLHLVPVGVPGELCIGGDGLARGYLNRPELAAEKFIPDPFSKEPGRRLYKTGDLARYLPDGNLEFLGRLDHQVKIRGFRVELKEIEAALGQHPAVQKTVVLARENARGDAQLGAYVVPNQQLAPTTSQLHTFLKEKLPVYMLPSSFVLLDALPLTPTGKVDRQALPAPKQTRPGLEEAFVIPRDALEVQLTEIWEKIPDVQSIGIRDNFFELGGHSLLAVRLGASIEKKFSKDLPLATLFQAPTIEQLVTLLRQGGWSDRRTLLGPPPRDGSMVPFFGLSVLARHLGMNQPFYELRPYGLDGRRAPSTVEDMAVGHIEEILALQPQGPYCLGGYSFGGLVAFEVAHKLRKQGQEVALLVLLDPTIPGNARASLVATSFRANVARHLDNLLRLRPQEKLTYVLARVWGKLDGKVKSIERRTTRTIKQTACRFWLGLGHRLPPGLCRFYFNEVAHQAAREYVPQVYPSTVVLFVAEKRNDDPRSDCARVAAGGLKIHQVPGDHFDMIKEPSLLGHS
jgi:aspartate racemase